MTNLFPLQLTASDTLLSQSSLLSGAITTTEAWLNFQTMGLNWFEDEARSPRFRYRFITQDELELQCRDGLSWQKKSDGYAYISQNNGLNCLILIALTERDLNQAEQISLENRLRQHIVDITNHHAQALNLHAIKC